MAKTLRLEIVTPEAKAYSDDVDMVVIPGRDGELGVYPQHVPVLTTIKPGELRVLKGNTQTLLAVGDGICRDHRRRRLRPHRHGDGILRDRRSRGRRSRSRARRLR